MSDENPNTIRMPDEDSSASAKGASSRSAPVWAAAITFAVVAVWFAGRSRSTVVAGPWLELTIQTGSIYHRPLLTAWLAELCSVLTPAVSLGVLNIVNGILGAICCALVAALAAGVPSPRTERTGRILCGCTAGLLFAFTGAWQTATQGLSPATVTVALALAGFLCVQRPGSAISLSLVFGGAVFVGLAAANDPAFGVIALLLAMLAIGAAAERHSALAILFTYLAGFAIAASIPLVFALSRGEGIPGFLAHALSTPYPTIGDGVPQFGYLPRLTGEFTWPVLLAALGGIVLLIGRGPSRQTFGWALVFLAMGPFLPALTNQSNVATVLTDPLASQAMVLIAVSIFAAWGAYIAIGLAVAKASWGVRRNVLLGLCGLVMAGVQWWNLPPAADGTAERLARAVLSDCPQGAILVNGGPRVHSLISTVQATRGLRPDITVLPADALGSPRLRRRLKEAGLPDVTLDPTFPPADALERWPRERPQAVEALRETQRGVPTQRSDLQELAVWELVRDNFRTHPICFAGVSAAWLNPRVQRKGVVLVFPRIGDTSQSSFELIANHINGLEDRPQDSELHRTMVDLLLPLSDAARRQGNLAQAAQAAELAGRIGGSGSGPLLASARAAARAGDREQAVAFVEAYLWSHPQLEAGSTLTETIQDELTRNALAENYEASFGDAVLRGGALQNQKDLAESLWALDELEVLARGYRKNRDRYLAQGDVDALCEGAAVYAQLGELAAARAELGEAVSLDAIRVWRLLKSDPRFNLLRIEIPPGQTADG